VGSVATGAPRLFFLEKEKHEVHDQREDGREPGHNDRPLLSLARLSPSLEFGVLLLQDTEPHFQISEPFCNLEDPRLKAIDIPLQVITSFHEGCDSFSVLTDEVGIGWHGLAPRLSLELPPSLVQLSVRPNHEQVTPKPVQSLPHMFLIREFVGGESISHDTRPIGDLQINNPATLQILGEAPVGFDL